MEYLDEVLQEKNTEASWTRRSCPIKRSDYSVDDLLASLTTRTPKPYQMKIPKDLQLIYFRGLTGPVVHSLMTIDRLNEFLQLLIEDEEAGDGEMYNTFNAVCKELYTTPEEHKDFSERLAKMMERTLVEEFLPEEWTGMKRATP